MPAALTPLVLLHGFIDSPRTWDLVRPYLEPRHEVLAPALPGHAGGPPFSGDMAGHVERLMDAAGFETAHVAGNSLGGYVALQLAERDRARSVVALAPAGGWADDSYKETLALQASMHEALATAAPHADALVATPEGRRRATAYTTVEYEHIPPELLADQIRAAAAADAPRMIEYALRHGWPLDPQKVTCPLRIVWGLEDRLLPWPSAAARYRADWFPHADWIELDGVGHCPQLDVPLETAQLILGFTERWVESPAP
jgi:pimeloyl-ACP methyl ester carboxylesterase